MSSGLPHSRFGDGKFFITEIAGMIAQSAKNEESWCASTIVVQHNGSLLLVREVRYSLHTIVRFCLDIVPYDQDFYRQYAPLGNKKPLNQRYPPLRVTEFVSKAIGEEIVAILDDEGRFQLLQDELEKYGYIVEKSGKGNSQSEFDRQLKLSWI